MATSENEADEVEIHTDGACRGNPGLGAWAAVLRWRGHEKEIAGVVENTTNNRMELEAVIRALEELRRPSKVRIFTDSNYVERGITEWLPRWKRNGWRTSSRTAVRNRDLWERLDELARRHSIRWAWVPGHSGDPYNERCDALCNEAMDRYVAERRGTSP